MKCYVLRKTWGWVVIHMRAIMLKTAGYSASQKSNVTKYNNDTKAILHREMDPWARDYEGSPVHLASAKRFSISPLDIYWNSLARLVHSITKPKRFYKSINPLWYHNEKSKGLGDGKQARYRARGCRTHSSNVRQALAWLSQNCFPLCKTVSYQ